MSAGLPQVITGVAWLTVSEAVPLLAEHPVEPVKLAPTPVGYEPALMPARLALLRVAVPVPSVTALPTPLPFSVKLTVLPDNGLPAAVSVADKFTVPPWVP